MGKDRNSVENRLRDASGDMLIEGLVIYEPLTCLIGTLIESLKNVTNERRCHEQ